MTPLFPTITPDIARRYIAIARETKSDLTRQIAEIVLRESSGLFYACTPVNENKQNHPSATTQKRAVENAALVVEYTLSKLARVGGAESVLATNTSSHDQTQKADPSGT